MYKLGARLFSLGCKKYNLALKLFEDDFTHWRSQNMPSFRFTQSLEGRKTSDNVNKLNEVLTPHVLSIITNVEDLGFMENEIKKVIQSQPALLKTSAAVWKNTLNSLINGGLEKTDVLTILEKWPQVLSLNKSDLDKNLQAWFECGFGDDLLYNILTTYPFFLQVNHNHVSKRVKQYQSYFESKINVANLLLLAPNTLEETWDVLLDKLNYLDELCTEKMDVIRTGVLAYTVLHIKARHEFLIRAGIYKRPQKNFNKRLSQNPKLTRIVNTSDRDFVRDVARLSELEYEIFLEMFEKELEENKIDVDLDEEELMKLSYRKHTKRKSRN